MPTEKFLSCLHAGSRFVIASHEKPDGDCIFSSLALASCLKRLGKEVLLYNPGPFARREIRQYKQQFRYAIPLQWAHKSSVLVLVDCATKERARLHEQSYDVDQVLIMDHHTARADDGAIPYICSASPSTTLMVQRLIEHVDEVTREEAYFMLLGFLTDSGFFRHLHTSSEHALPYVTRLLSHGHSLRDLYTQVFATQLLVEARFVSEIIMRAQPFLGDRLIMAVRTKKMSKKYNLSYVNGEYVNAQLQLIRGVEVTVLFTELGPDLYDVSMRAFRSVNVSAIAETFGGGGHVAASGFRWKGTLDAIQMQLIQRVAPDLS